MNDTEPFTVLEDVELTPQTLPVSTDAPPPAPARTPHAALSRGTYAIYEKPSGALHVALLLDGEQVERHHTVPPYVVRGAARMAGIDLKQTSLAQIIAGLMTGTGE